MRSVTASRRGDYQDAATGSSTSPPYERAPQKYHHTVSRAWVEIVAHHANADPDCADFGIFADRHPALLDKRLLARHYRSSTLAAAPARIGWVEPDLLPFPWSPGQDTLPVGYWRRRREIGPRSTGWSRASDVGTAGTNFRHADRPYKTGVMSLERVG